MPYALDEMAVSARLTEIPGWVVQDDQLRRELSFADFSEAFAFMTRIALIAEKLNHHPDLFNSWNRLTIGISSHDAGGITDQDFEFATRVNKALIMSHAPIEL